MVQSSDYEENTDSHVWGNSSIGKTYFKVKFVYDTKSQGRYSPHYNTRIFDVFDADELHLKIDNYMKDRKNDLTNKWHSVEVLNIEKL